MLVSNIASSDMKELLWGWKKTKIHNGAATFKKNSHLEFIWFLLNWDRVSWKIPQESTREGPPADPEQKQSRGLWISPALSPISAPARTSRLLLVSPKRTETPSRAHLSRGPLESSQALIWLRKTKKQNPKTTRNKASFCFFSFHRLPRKSTPFFSPRFLNHFCDLLSVFTCLGSLPVSRRYSISLQFA